MTILQDKTWKFREAKQLRQNHISSAFFLVQSALFNAIYFKLWGFGTPLAPEMGWSNLETNSLALCISALDGHQKYA